MTSGVYKHKPRSEKTKKKISKSRLKRKQELGYLNNPATRKKMSIAKSGEKNGNWKGNKVKYRAIHKWVRNHKPKPKYNLCEFCHKRKIYDCANIKNHKYTRNFKDWKFLCKKCHKHFDFPKGWGNAIKNRRESKT